MKTYPKFVHYSCVSVHYCGSHKKKQGKNAPLEKVAIRKRRLQMNRKTVAGKEW